MTDLTREQAIERAAELLEREADTLRITSVRADGIWDDDIARSEYLELRAIAARLREVIAELDRPTKAARVLVYGMFDCHLFHQFKEPTPELIVEAWRALDDPELGKTDLCPVIVLNADNKELRRVGSGGTDAESWLRSVDADPDISRLLQEQYGPSHD